MSRGPFYLLWLLQLVFIAMAAPWLPEQVGDPGKTMSRSGFVALMLAMSVYLPWQCTEGVVWLVRRLPPALINLPNKDYWLAPERREATLRLLGDHMRWLGLMLLLLFSGLYCQALLTGQPTWPQVPPDGWLLGAGLLAVAFLVWIVALKVRLQKLEPQAADAADAVVRRQTMSSRNDELVWRESQLTWPVLVPLAMVGASLALLPRWVDGAWIAVGVAGVLLLLLGRLLTEVRGDALVWRFGWLGWPCWRVPLDQIAAVEAAHSTVLEGWGIRFTREGMLYNAHGLQAVRLTLRSGRQLRLGTREAQRLLQALRPRIAGSSA